MDGRILDDSSPQIKPPMPNLRKLAAAGAVFTTAYTESPQVCPQPSQRTACVVLASYLAIGRPPSAANSGFLIARFPLFPLATHAPTCNLR